jgi:hypothetical protein
MLYYIRRLLSMSLLPNQALHLTANSVAVFSKFCALLEFSVFSKVCAHPVGGR